MRVLDDVTPRCKDCKWWEPSGDILFRGECRGLPHIGVRAMPTERRAGPFAVTVDTLFTGSPVETEARDCCALHDWSDAAKERYILADDD